jgi:hypothetical protein
MTAYNDNNRLLRNFIVPNYYENDSISKLTAIVEELQYEIQINKLTAMVEALRRDVRQKKI